MNEPEVPIEPAEPTPIVKQSENGKGLTFSPITTAIIATFVGVLGTGLGAFLQGWFNMKLERQKFEAQLVLKAVESGDFELSKKNLLFLVNARYILQPPDIAALLPGERITVRTYDNPTVAGEFRLDFCYEFSAKCGQPAASAWCRSLGPNTFTGAFDFVQDYDVSRRGIQTKIISTGQICDAGRCDSFKSITCQYQ